MKKRSAREKWDIQQVPMDSTMDSTTNGFNKRVTMDSTSTNEPFKDGKMPRKANE